MFYKASKTLSVLTDHPYLLAKILFAKGQVMLRPSPDVLIHKKINGVVMPIDFSNKDLWDSYEFSQPAIKAIYYGAYEPLLIDIMHQILKAGDTFIDVGGNIGFISAIGAGFVGPSGRVHSFEPVPDYFHYLEMLASLNPDYTIVPNHMAVGDKDGVAKINIHRDNIGGSSLIADFEPESSVEVPVTRLDRYIKEKALEKIALIKIDVEGFEFPVLKGLQGYFESNTQLPPIICEIIPSAYQLLGSTLKELADYMQGYHYNAVKVENPKLAVDITQLDGVTNVLFVPEHYRFSSGTQRKGLRA